MRKGRLGKRVAASVQRQIIDQMKLYRRYPFTGPLALDLHAVAERRNPPSIHQVAKYLLDVLGAAEPSVAQPRRRSILYRDDRQVKYLHVALHQAWNPDLDRPGRPEDGTTHLIARAGRDIIADFQDADQLRRDTARDDESSPFWCPDLPDDPDWLQPVDTPTSESSALSSYLEESYRFYGLMRMQESLLARNDAILTSALAHYLHPLLLPPRCRWPSPPPAEFEELVAEAHDIQDMARKHLLVNPLTVPLPPLPQTRGASADFTQKAREQLRTYTERWPLFRPLVVSIKVTFLVVPPVQGKDLDNIALTVLPIVHDVLKPHIEPHLLAPTHPDGDPDLDRDKALARLRSLNADSVTAYQVIELPRSRQDPPEGVLRLALGVDTGRSWWEHVTDYVDQMVDEAESQAGPWRADGARH